MKPEINVGMTVTGKVGLNDALVASLVEDCSFAPACKNVKEFVEKAKAFLEAVDRIENSSDVRSMYAMAFVHGHYYRGPTWEKEFNALKTAIEEYEKCQSPLRKIS